VPTPVLPAVREPSPPPEPVIPPPTAFLTGTVVYRQRNALTPEAEVQVELRDVTLQDVESILIAKQVISTPGQVPISFSLEYDPTRIAGGRTYAISARITDRGQLQFVTDTRIPVLTGGLQAPVEIVVVPVR
jgi:putative lipoprotein